MTVTPETVARVVELVFRNPAYDRSLKETIFSIVTRWIGRCLSWLINAIMRVPGGMLIVQWTLYTVVAVLVGAIGYRIFQHYRETQGTEHVRFGGETAADLWAESRRAAERGTYTDAAHLLYAAVLRTLVLRGTLGYHASKTTGDYVRELRRNTDRTMLAHFSDFARIYEVVIYRDGTCDLDRYETLLALGEPLVRGRRAAA